MTNCKNIRIIDIARMAGVSVGTVDRVIHSRGRVSNENYNRVKQVLEQVDYHPNIIARSLASKRVYRIAVITPSFKVGEYWEYISRGVDYAFNTFGHYRLELIRYHFNQFDESSFARLLDEVKSALEQIDGVLLGTLFTNLVNSFSKELDLLSIPYVYVDSDLPNEKRMAFVGTDSWTGGRIAARIIMKNIDVNDDILMGHIIHSGLESTQVRNRQNGFRSYLEDKGFKGKIYDVYLQLEKDNTPLLDNILSECPHIRGSVMFNSRAYMIGDYLMLRKRKDICLVGYDLIERNARLLEEEYIEALIDQQPQMQGYIGIKLLCERLILDKPIKPNNMLPIDILIKENYAFREIYE